MKWQNHGKIGLLLMILALLGLALSPASAAATYNVTDLGTLPGGTYSNAYGLNGSGQVVGGADNASGYRAFLWSGGTMTSLGTLPGGSYSSAYGINGSGQVVGGATAGTDRDYHARSEEGRVGKECRSRWSPYH